MISSRAGILITFEGSEGCGKSTQIARLAEWLRQKNSEKEILLLREPGGTALGEKIRDLLQYTHQTTAMVAEAELLLFSASRAQLMREVIRPALERGAMVLCDRFIDSTTVYQGIARGLDREQVEVINRFTIGKILPDLTFLLDMEAAEGRSRMKHRNATSAVVDRMEQEPEAFYEAVRQGYLVVAKRESQRFVIIDAARTPDEVAQQIQEHLSCLEKSLSPSS
jgi:dTMP kinase